MECAEATLFFAILTQKDCSWETFFRGDRPGSVESGGVSNQMVFLQKEFCNQQSVHENRQRFRVRPKEIMKSLFQNCFYLQFCFLK